ncbi:nuclear transport factor 2 family protein [Streptomyces sp. WMMB 322]|uniref:nuclear transport factor 2 family protein n=1 Tax=Streptomyces sp. WMMB 322 TaxID=1286821 RepID=UPI0006E33D11|nr:nuclear transport factor 2 family protein [Streptomyces sp. WMMB 322]SCK33413.1 SnoaL-like domain-containing protein [Streptomyces sp. WMMB 322]
MQVEPGEDAVDTFLAAFNAPNQAYVTELLSRALTQDVVFWGPLGRSTGVEAVENFINELRAHPDGPGKVTRTTVVDAPGEWARYSWSYHNGAGQLLLTGTDMVHLRDERIDQMVVFAGDLAAI